MIADVIDPLHELYSDDKLYQKDYISSLIAPKRDPAIEAYRGCTFKPDREKTSKHDKLASEKYKKDTAVTNDARHKLDKKPKMKERVVVLYLEGLQKINSKQKDLTKEMELEKAKECTFKPSTNQNVFKNISPRVGTSKNSEQGFY